MAKPGGERKPKEGDRLRTAKADVRVGGTAAEAAPAPTAPTTAAAAAPPDGDSLLKLLLDTRQGWAVLMVLAAGFGAVHALTPGHGKTLVAAYLVGERGTVGHAVLLGITTTITHTAAVLAVAGLLPLFFPGARRPTCSASSNWPAACWSPRSVSSCSSAVSPAATTTSTSAAAITIITTTGTTTITRTTTTMNRTLMA